MGASRITSRDATYLLRLTPLNSIRAERRGLHILQYPHPALRYTSKPLRRVDASLAQMVREMFDLMYQAKGIGLAANQVELPYRLFVLNLESDPKARDQEYVFINPVLTQRKGSAEAEEGCLSIPGLYGDVRRPERVTVNAFDLAGKELTLELDGLFARAVQHELDHLDGVLFIDRLSATRMQDAQPTLRDMEDQFAAQLARGELPKETDIVRRLRDLEEQRT